MTSQTDTVAPTDEQEPVSAGTRVVLIDARPDRRAVMRQMFEHGGMDAAVVGEADGEADAIALVESHDAGLAVIDLPLPARGGLDTIAALRRRFPDLAIVVSSFNTDPETRKTAVDQGADAYLVKPVNVRELLAAMPKAPTA